MVDHPDEIEVEEIEGERDGVVVEITVHPEDMGKIIGKRGRIIRALRLVAKAAGQRQGENVAVEVVD